MGEGGDDDAGTPDASPDAALLTDCDQLQAELQQYAEPTLASSEFKFAGLMQLVEEGVLSLDDTLSNWRTDIPNAESITLRHLLNHTSGVPDYLNDVMARKEALESNPSRVWTIEEILDCIDGLSPLFSPGEEWHYRVSTTPLYTYPTFSDDRYGLGIQCAHETNAGEVRGHKGGSWTALSQVWYSPSWDSSVVFQVNHSAVGDEYYDWFYRIASELFDMVGRSPGFY